LRRLTEKKALVKSLSAAPRNKGCDDPNPFGCLIGMQDVINLMKAEGEVEGSTDMIRFFDPALVPK